MAEEGEEGEGGEERRLIDLRLASPLVKISNYHIRRGLLVTLLCSFGKDNPDCTTSHHLCNIASSSLTHNNHCKLPLSYAAFPPKRGERLNLMCATEGGGRKMGAPPSLPKEPYSYYICTGWGPGGITNKSDGTV